MRLNCVFCIQFKVFCVTKSALEALHRHIEFEPNTVFPHIHAYLSNVGMKPLEENYWQLEYYLKPIDVWDTEGTDREELMKTVLKTQVPEEWLRIMKAKDVLVQ